MNTSKRGCIGLILIVNGAEFNQVNTWLGRISTKGFDGGRLRRSRAMMRRLLTSKRKQGGSAMGGACYVFGDRYEVLSESGNAPRQVRERKRPGCWRKARFPFSVITVGSGSFAGEFSSISRYPARYSSRMAGGLNFLPPTKTCKNHLAWSASIGQGATCPSNLPVSIPIANSIGKVNSVFAEAYGKAVSR